MFSRKVKSAPAEIEQKSTAAQHVERLPSGKAGEDGELATAALPAGLQDVDAETAKYLDPNLVIDEATNRSVKRMVCLHIPTYRSACEIDEPSAG